MIIKHSVAGAFYSHDGEIFQLLEKINGREIVTVYYPHSGVQASVNTTKNDKWIRVSRQTAYAQPTIDVQNDA